MKSSMMVLFLSFLFVSCSGDAQVVDVPEEEDVVVETVLTDTATVATTGILEGMTLAKFDAGFNAPYFTDSTTIFDSVMSMKGPQLQPGEIRQLAINYQDFILGGSYYIENLITPDTTLNNPGGDSFFLTRAWACKKIDVNDSLYILLWCIEHESQEGCGGGGGTAVQATAVIRDTAVSCTSVGGYDEGGEPGFSSYSTTWFEIDSTATITVRSIDESTETDFETGEETTTRTLGDPLRFALINSVWELTGE